MAPGATTKKNKEKTSVKYIALPATLPSGLNNIAWCVALLQSTPQVDFTDNPHSQQSFAFYDGRLLDQVRQGDQHVHQFFRLLALCHTVMPELKEGTSPASFSCAVGIFSPYRFGSLGDTMYAFSR